MTDTSARAKENKQVEQVETSAKQEPSKISGDPDEKLAVRKLLKERLLRQKRAVDAGERGVSLDEVVQRLRLE